MEHSKPLFLDLKILNIYQINDYLCRLFMYHHNYYQNLPDFYKVTSNKITMYTTIIREILPSYMRVIKEQTTVYFLYLTMEFLYGIFLMMKLKTLKHIFILREKQNPFTYLIN